MTCASAAVDAAGGSPSGQVQAPRLARAAKPASIATLLTRLASGGMGQRIYVITNPAGPDYVKVGASCESPLCIGLREALLEFGMVHPEA